jgi:hypothetical protein
MSVDEVARYDGQPEKPCRLLLLCAETAHGNPTRKMPGWICSAGASEWMMNMDESSVD